MDPESGCCYYEMPPGCTFVLLPEDRPRCQFCGLLYDECRLRPEGYPACPGRPQAPKSEV